MGLLLSDHTLYYVLKIEFPHLEFTHVQYFDRANRLNSAFEVKSPREKECIDSGDVSKLGDENQ
jgi:hypothetical protein